MATADSTPALLLVLPRNTPIARALARHLGGTDGDIVAVGDVDVHRFPDGESLVRLPSGVAGRDVALVCTLDRPDENLLPLVFAARTARDLGAVRVGLVAPYLAYMRQDRRFHPGEALSARELARLLGGAFDWLATVGPHLHRVHDLRELYLIPCAVAHAAPAVARWIADNVPAPPLVGPDDESAQWVRAVAELAGAPSVVLEKMRGGDRDVAVSVPEVARWRSHTPVLVDDIASTARTMIAAVRHLLNARMAPPVCVAVHGILADDAADALAAAGAARMVTCNTVPHPSNTIDVTPALAAAVRAARVTAPARGAGAGEDDRCVCAERPHDGGCMVSHLYLG